SLLFGNWITRIPDIKDAIGLSEGELGLALLGAPIGAMCIMPLSGWVIARFDLGRTLVVSGLAHVLALPLLALSDSFWGLVVALFFFGFTNAIMDISMNATAAAIERKHKRAIMSTCHGMWSLGGMAGAALGSVLAGLEISTVIHLAFVAAAIFIMILLLSGSLFRIKESRNVGDKVFAWPRGPLLLLAFMAFCILLSEGAIADWSAVYMRDVVVADAYLVGMAYAGFSMLMAIGRLTGDSIIPRLGKKHVVLYGSLLSVIGLFMAMFFEAQMLVIIGFSITGLGYSCIVPVLFISGANQPGYTAGTGIAAVTTLGYAGFLVGPPLIGILAEEYGLTMGMWFVLFCSLMVSVLSITTKFR
ncbi:MAG: MFS transporter, partial [Pseudomonadales bacterium]